MKKILSLLLTILFFSNFIFAQEALKSTEEEYYDFLSLQGLVTRPTLGYRTLSDSVWQFTSQEAEQNHVWSENNLGKTFTLFETEQKSQNTFVKALKQGLYLKVYGPEWFNSYNTKAPYGQNDGALWQGRGYNTSFTSGLRLEGYGFEATIKPQISFSENRGFEYIASNFSNETDSIFKDKAGVFGYYGVCCIDAPQRFGNKAFWNFDWGDSEIRYSWNVFTIGFGTQIPWIGPAIFNPIIHSNNSASYPKFDFGIRKTDILVPVTNFSIGQIEARFWTGRLSESEYFDNLDNNDYNLITGFNFSYSPFFAPDFSVGLSKVCISTYDHFRIQYFNPFYDSNSAVGEQDGSGEDQKVSVFAQWNFPQVGFSLYGEVAIDDYFSGGFARGLLRYPYDTMIGSFGFQKSMTLSESKKIYGKLMFEWSAMEMPRNRLSSGTSNYVFNTHYQIKQGYVNEGQYLGTNLANGGNSQTLKYILYYPSGNTTFLISRNNPDLTFSYRTIAQLNYEDKKYNDEHIDKREVTGNMNGFYKANFNIGISSLYFINKNFSINGQILLNEIINPKDVTEDSDDWFNFHIELGCKYNF